MESLFDSELCVKCKGRGYCGKSCRILNKLKAYMPKTKLHFSGSSPPEIFVGRHNYPDVYSGILSPQEYGDTSSFSMPEIWHKEKFEIEDILNLRAKMIYGRFRINIKSRESRFKGMMEEIAMASKPVSSEFFLKRAPSSNFEASREVAIIGNPAPLVKARLEENPHIEKKVDYLVSDTNVKANTAMNELYNSRIEVSNIIKVLSAGLLGIKRKLVPTRWAITATDDSLGKMLLDKIRYYPEISEIELFHSEYLGNHYEFLLLPDKFSFEVIEAKMTGSVWNPQGNLYLAQDYEGFNGRKEYAFSVTGAYYVNRLALVEYFERVHKQASCLVMRECRPEYYAPCGVGILREASREAFKNKAEKFSDINSALKACQARMRLDVSVFKDKSWLLKEHGKQKKISNWL